MGVKGNKELKRAEAGNRCYQRENGCTLSKRSHWPPLMWIDVIIATSSDSHIFSDPVLALGHVLGTRVGMDWREEVRQTACIPPFFL